MLTFEPASLSAKARELRQVFDATFAVPPPPPAPPAVALLLVRAGGEVLAVRRTELTGFVQGEALALAPGQSPAFLGLVGVRGGLYPVWSLAGLVGGPTVPAGAACWLLLAAARAEAPCAFACEAFEKMIFVPETAFANPARRDAANSLTQAMVSWGNALVPVVDLPALQADLWKRKESTQPRKSPA
jgi:purine-binding chemotaxis protein CheW